MDCVNLEDLYDALILGPGTLFRCVFIEVSTMNQKIFSWLTISVFALVALPISCEFTWNGHSQLAAGRCRFGLAGYVR